MKEIFINALVGLISALIGAATVWLFESRRDRQSKRRDIRVSYLIEAYRGFESVCHRPPLGPDGAKTLESALADIQLFGYPSQVELARKFVNEYSAQKHADVDLLLADLRRDLRAELGIEPGHDKTFFLRVTWDKKINSQQGQPG